MKKLTQILMLLFMGFAVNGAAQNASVANAAHADEDTVVTSQIMDADTAADSLSESVTFTYQTGDLDQLENIVESSLSEAATALVGPMIISALFIIAVTVLIIFIIWIRYKQNKEKMRVISESIAAGKPVDHLFFDKKEYIRAKQSANQIYRNMVWEKGIRNICTGVALMVFLYVLTDELSLASIGFIVLCTGVGQVIISKGRNYTDESGSNASQKAPEAREDTSEENKQSDSEPKAND